MNIKEELNKLDQNTFNQYDLFNLYSSIKVDKELKEQVVGLIKESKCEELCKLLSEAYEKQTGIPLTEEAYDNLPEIEDKVKGVTDQVTAKAVKDHEKKQKNIKKGLEAADAEIKDEPFTSGENQPKPKKPEVPDALTEGYRGSTEVELISNGAWSDPELEWNGYTFNYWDIEDALWNNFLEDTGHTDNESDDTEVEKEFDKYVQENVVPYLEDVIAGGYFKEGSKHWTGNDVVSESVDTDKPFEELDAVAMEYYDNRDGESFNSFSDGELAVLWANCAITNANPWGQPYDDEVYEAIYKRPNKQEIFDKAREIALSFNAKDESLKEGIPSLKEVRKTILSKLSKGSTLDEIKDTIRTELENAYGEVSDKYYKALFDDVILKLSGKEGPFIEPLNKYESLKESNDAEQYKIFYDYCGEDGTCEYNCSTTFTGTWSELQDYLKDMRESDCCSNIEATAISGDFDESLKEDYAESKLNHELKRLYNDATADQIRNVIINQYNWKDSIELAKTLRVLGVNSYEYFRVIKPILLAKQNESLKESGTVDTGHYALWDEEPYTKEQLLYELNSDKMLEKAKGSFQVGHPDERDICAEILSDAGYEYEISGDGPWFHFEYWKTQE